MKADDGDVIVLTHDGSMRGEAQQIAQALGSEMQRQGKPNVTILVLGLGFTVDILDESAMRKAGWARMSPELREIEAALAAQPTESES